MHQLPRKTAFHYDLWILVPFLLLLGFGVLMVSSASMVISDKLYGEPFYFLVRESFYGLAGLFLVWLCAHVPIAVWHRHSVHLLLLGLLLLVLVLIPGVGHVVNGSRRWFSLGLISFQVSEGVKFGSILYLSRYLDRFQREIHSKISGFIKPMLVLSVLAGLLLLEPDFGATTVISACFLALLFIAGVRIWPFLLLFTAMIVGLGFLAIMEPYRLARLTTFLNPWHYAFSSGYQLTQSLIAFGRGGLWGVGLGNSVQKLFYLPESHTDFIFAVLVEELGFLGILVLLLLYGFLVIRVFWVGQKALQAGQLFLGYLNMGMGFWLVFQTLVNMGVSSGLLPTKGLTLPFISYGGSSLLVNCVMVGLLLRVSYEADAY